MLNQMFDGDQIIQQGGQTLQHVEFSSSRLKIPINLPRRA